MDIVSEVPQDIVRLIFEITAESDRKTALTLICVSKLVQTWIDPVLFRTVVIRSPRALASFCSLIGNSGRPLAFWQDTVTCLVFVERPSRQESLDLRFEDYASTIKLLCPYQISCPPNWLPSITTPYSRSVITHLNLDFFSPEYPAFDCSSIRDMTRLRYLSVGPPLDFYNGWASPLPAPQTIYHGLDYLLKECPISLRVLMIKIVRMGSIKLVDFEELATDPRVVVQYQTNVMSGPEVRRTATHLEANFWALDDNWKWFQGGVLDTYRLAEDVVAERLKETQV